MLAFLFTSYTCTKDNVINKKPLVFLYRWSYGILLWETYSLGGFPYIGDKNMKVRQKVLSGTLLKKPTFCSHVM